MRPFLIASTMLLALFTAACSSAPDQSGSTAPPISTTPSIALSLNSSTVTAGGATANNAANVLARFTVQRRGGYTGAVTVAATGLPTGVQAAASPVLASIDSLGSWQFTVSATAASGSYPLVLTASGAGVNSATASLTLVIQPNVTAPTLTLTTANVSVERGQTSGLIPVVITRTVNALDTVLLSVDSLPNGVAATWSSANTVQDTTQLRFTVGALVPVSQYRVFVRATQRGVSTTSLMLLNVTNAPGAVYTLSAPTSPVAIARGQSGTANIAINRSGGFADTVTLSSSGAPNGMSVTFVPSKASGAQAAANILVGANVQAGSYPITIRGSAPGLTDRTTTLTVNVTAPTVGTVDFRYCRANRMPVWFAYQDGTNGTWTRVLPDANMTFRVNFTQPTGAIATRGAQGFMNVIYQSFNEMVATAQEECITAPAASPVSGTVAGLGTNDFSPILFGGGAAVVSAGATDWSIPEVANGTRSLWAARIPFAGGGTVYRADRVIVRRNLSVPTSGPLAVLDFNSAESFATIAADYTAANTLGDSITLTSALYSGGFGAPVLSQYAGTAPTASMVGIPLSRITAEDLHVVFLEARGPNGFRAIRQFNSELRARTLTLGPPLAAVSASVSGTSPYPRLTLNGTWQPEYSQVASAVFSGTAGKTWVIAMSRAYAGASATAITITMPDLTAAAGFDIAWAFPTGTNLSWSLGASGTYSSSSISDNYSFIDATRRGTITP